YLLPDVVVSRSLPGADRRLFHGGDSAVHGDRCPRVRFAAGARRVHGPEGMAMAVPPRSRAGAVPVGGRFLLSPRPACRRDVAGAGRTGLAGVAPGGRATAAGNG